MSQTFHPHVIFEIQAETEESAKFLLSEMLRQKGVLQEFEDDPLHGVFTYKQIDI